MSKKAIGFTASLFIMAGIGLFSMVYNDPWGTLKTAGVLLVVAGILFFVYRYLSKSVSTNSIDAGYKKALQQQKRKNKGKGKETVNFKPFPSTQPEKSKKASKFKNTPRRNHSFQVIEGKKNKNERTKTS